MRGIVLSGVCMMKVKGLNLILTCQNFELARLVPAASGDDLLGPWILK